MEVVLGVSMTPTVVRMVLVEGEKAEGVTVDRDAFELSASDGGAISSPSDQVIDAVLGTREGAVAAGHHLVSTGVAWKDRAEAAALQQALSERGIDDVTLFSEAQAAGALAQAIGKAVGYDTTALMVVEPDTATLSVVQTADGSIVKLVSRSLAGADAMAAVTDMVAGLETQEPRPDGMFVVGSGADALSVKSNLERLLSLPVRAPDEPELALARAAALAAANASRIDATTVGLAYSRERDQDSTGVDHFDAVMQGPDEVAQNRKPFLLAGSALTTIFAVGVVGLVVSLAVNIQTAADQRAAPGESVFHPKALAAAPPKIENVQPVDPRPVPQSIPIPDPAVGSPQTPLQEAAPDVMPQEVAPPPRALPHAPASPGPPAAPVGPAPATLPAPVIQLPLPGFPPILLTPAYEPPAMRPPWYPIPQPPQWQRPGHGRHGGERDN